MQLIPPWPEPTSYCQAVNRWTVALPLPNPVNPAQLIVNTYTIWSSDHVFCLDGTKELWLLFLFLGGALWLLLTIIRLFHTFDWRGFAGFTPSEVVKVVGAQVMLLLVAVSSFALLLQVHQANFLFINSLLGGLPDQLVDSLWGRLDQLLAASEAATQNLDPNGWIGGLFGGNLPDNSAPFGLTWGQIFGGIGSVESFLLTTLLPVRFTAQFVAVVTAPLAILTYSLPALRRFFWVWFEFWLEIEALAAGSAILLAGYQQLAHPLTTHTVLGFCGSACGLFPTEQALILLSFAGLVCLGNFAFMWRILGSFLTNITSIYQQQYQRERQFWGVLAQAAVGIVGAAATILTGGAALPYALAAEGVVSGVEELGAVPASPVPGAGVRRAGIEAGRTSALRRAGAGTGPAPSGQPPAGAGGIPGPGGAGGSGAGWTPGSGGGTPGGSSSGSGRGMTLPFPPSGSPGGSSGTPGPLPLPALPGAGASPASPFGGGGSTATTRTVAGSAGGTPSVGSGWSGAAAGLTLPSVLGQRVQASVATPVQAAARSSPAPLGATSRGYAGGSGGFFHLDPPATLWAPPGGQPLHSASYFAAGRDAARDLPEVLKQLPVPQSTLDRLLAPTHNARGMEMDRWGGGAYHSFYQNAARHIGDPSPETGLQYSWQGQEYLRYWSPTGQATGVALSHMERLIANQMPYLRDAVDLYTHDWIRPEQQAHVAWALGQLYYSQPKGEYPANINVVQTFLHDHAQLFVEQPDAGFQELLRCITDLMPSKKGAQP